jgi:hypothetical protein
VIHPRSSLRRRPAGAFLVLTAVLAGVPAAALTGCGAAPATSRIMPAATTEPSLDPSARAGGLVDGFPAVVPVPTGAHVTASAVQARGDLLAVSVTGTSALSVPALLAWFRGRLRAEGFTATDDTLLPRGASGAAYGRPGGVELLLVAVVDRGGERSWSVGGTVAPRRERI